MYITRNNRQLLSDMVSVSLSALADTYNLLAFYVFLLLLLNVACILVCLLLRDCGSEVELDLLGGVVAGGLRSFRWHQGIILDLRRIARCLRILRLHLLHIQVL